MTPHVQKAMCVLWQHEKKIVVTVQKNRYEIVFGTTNKTLQVVQFDQFGWLFIKRKVAEAPVTFISRPRKLTRQSACKLHATVDNTQNSENSFEFERYEYQFLQYVTALDIFTTHFVVILF